MKARLIIDGAYLLISTKTHYNEILCLFKYKEGVKTFLQHLSDNILKTLKETNNLSAELSKKFNEVDKLVFSKKHILYSVDGIHNPEMIFKEAWEDFGVMEDVHHYKIKNAQCKKCGEVVPSKIQSGVDVGITTRLAEAVLLNKIGKEEEKSDVIVLVAGDKDFKDILNFCMKYKENVILVGYNENTDKEIRKLCVRYMDIKDLVKAPPINKMQFIGMYKTLLEIRNISNDYKESAFLNLLKENTINILKHKWVPDRNNPNEIYALLYFNSEIQAIQAMTLVIFI